MLLPAEITEAKILDACDPIAQEARASAKANARSVFKMLHGFYGNLFLAKFQTGVVDEHGSDKGVKSTILVWARDLREFDEATLLAAVDQCKLDHKDFPPNLPQFSAICRAKREAAAPAQKPAHLRIGISPKLTSKYARQARAINERHAAAKRGTYRVIPSGLHGLKEAIADAAACAGGDEVAILRRLDLELASKTRTAA